METALRGRLQAVAHGSLRQPVSTQVERFEHLARMKQMESDVEMLANVCMKLAIRFDSMCQSNKDRDNAHEEGRQIHRGHARSVAEEANAREPNRVDQAAEKSVKPPYLIFHTGPLKGLRVPTSIFNDIESHLIPDELWHEDADGTKNFTTLVTESS